jgi:hypothetical protein
MKKIKAKKMATGGLMSMPPYIAKQDEESDGITPYDVNTPMSARKGLPSRVLDKTRTRFNQGGIMDRVKFGDGDLSTREVIEMRKMEKLEAMKDSGLELTEAQEQELESYKASKNVKPKMALGGMVGVEKGKYDQRPDYQSYAEGDIVEDESPEEEMPVMEEMEVEENESLLQPMGMEEEMPMDDEEDISDEELESMDAIIDTSALSEEEEKVLDDAVEMHPELESIIPKLVATEFTEDGEVTGPGTGTSDSIPALLSDGEFVFTAKAVKNIGVDKLRKMMKQAEEAYDAGIKSQEEPEEIV